MSFIWLILIWGFVLWMRSVQRNLQNRQTGGGRQALLDGLCGMLAKMAKVDGRVSKAEVEQAQTFLRGLKLAPAEYRFCVSRFNAAIDSPLSFGHYASIFASRVSEEGRVLVYEILWSIAVADGVIRPTEDRLLQQAVADLAVSPELYRYFRARATSGRSSGASSGGTSRQGPERELSEAYATLGCSATSTDEELRSAYRKLAMRYHPDRLRAEGLPEGMLKKATASMAAINAAWNVVRAHRHGL